MLLLTQVSLSLNYSNVTVKNYAENQGNCTEIPWKGYCFAMFTVSNAGENSGETYKLSSDVGTYIFVLLKILGLVFFHKGQQEYPTTVF